MDFIHQIEPLFSGLEPQAFADYLATGGWLTEFKKTQEFEDSIKSLVKAEYAVALPNGTVGLYLALLAAGIQPGDKVIVPNYTMIATINAVVWAGAKPVIVDVTSEQLCMDPNQVDSIQDAKAVIYVDINGRSEYLKEIRQICSKRGMILIEDACQALGSKSADGMLGSLGDLGVYSFTPHKIITTGQGGMVVTSNKQFYEKLKKLKDFHRTAPATDWHDGLGFNFKFTDIQALIGLEQFKSMEFRIRRKKEIYQSYFDRLSHNPSIKFFKTNLQDVAPWFIDIALESRSQRDSLMAFLKENKIGSRSFYPPLNHQPMFSSDFPIGSFPRSEDLAHKGLWLPSSISLKDETIGYICDFVEKGLRSKV